MIEAPVSGTAAGYSLNPLLLPTRNRTMLLLNEELARARMADVNREALRRRQVLRAAKAQRLQRRAEAASLRARLALARAAG